MNVSFFQELLTKISQRGRSLIDLPILGAATSETLEELSRALLTGRGEASGVALASQILERYESLDEDERQEFFCFLADEFVPDEEAVKEAAQTYLAAPSNDTMWTLSQVIDSPRKEFFRRLNLAPDATAKIVAMRENLFGLMREETKLAQLDGDLSSLLSSWFNRGFLVMQRIDWSTPASILDKIIAYEAVHEIQGWDDLRRRLDPIDRRCFGFFHPSLVDDPLIFVQVALTHKIPESIQRLLLQEPKVDDEFVAPTTAVFYSISNCQAGLRGISFGNFLIKQVVEELAKEIPSLKTFVTLSPVPGFTQWLSRVSGQSSEHILSGVELSALEMLEEEDWFQQEDIESAAKEFLLPLAAHYFLVAKNRAGEPVDPVARFHLGNGAQLERINWLGDISKKGMSQSYGLMVNYLYELKNIERHHEAYENNGFVTCSKSVRNLMRPVDKKRMLVAANE